MQPDWKTVATERFRQYRAEANKYAAENNDVKELALINAGKAVALSELLEMFGAKPAI